MSANYLWDKASEVQNIEIPEYTAGKADETVYPINNGARLYRINETTGREYRDYCKTLADNGFELESEYKTEEHDCAAFFKNGNLVYVYFCASDSAVRIITEPHGMVPPMPEVVSGGCEVHQLSLDQREIDCGMSYVIKLCDGSFFMIDGGYFTKGECERLYEYLESLADGEIVISGWFFSHAHEDHFGCFMNFVEKFGDRVRIDALYYNFPNMYVKQAEHWNSCDIAATEDFYRIVNGRLSGIPQIKLHTGEVFNIKNLSFEVLFTHEDLYPNEIWNFNDSSTILMMTVNGKKVLWLGDMSDDASDIIIPAYGERLKCDVVQVAHHGFNGAKKTVYELADPTIAFWPTADYRFDENIPRPANTFLLKESRVTDHLISGFGTKSIKL